MSDALSLANILPSSALSEIDTLSPPESASEQFLRFHLAPDTTALLPIKQLTEVLTISNSQIVPIFNMPTWVMGVYNWRGEILWIVDLGHRIGLTPLLEQATNRSTYTAIVLHAHSTRKTRNPAKRHTLGLIVNRVEDIEWCNPDLIQSPPTAAIVPEIVPFLRGYWVKDNGDMLSVLDGTAILASMPRD
jgi:positive phototaxis protein PixI